MSDFDREDLGEFEALLRRSRPEPSPDTVDRLERRLLGSPARSRRGIIRWRPLVAGLGAAAASAAVVLGVTATGAGPLSTGEDVRARDTCEQITVTRQVRKPVLVQGRDGEPRVEYRTTTERRPVTRCR